MDFGHFWSHSGGLHDPEGTPSAAARLLLIGVVGDGRVGCHKISVFGRVFLYQVLVLPKKKNRKKLQKLVLLKKKNIFFSGPKKKSYGPSGRFLGCDFFVLEKFRVFGDFPWEITQKSKNFDFFFGVQNGFLYGLGVVWGLSKWILGISDPIQVAYTTRKACRARQRGSYWYGCGRVGYHKNSVFGWVFRYQVLVLPKKKKSQKTPKISTTFWYYGKKIRTKNFWW